MTYCQFIQAVEETVKKEVREPLSVSVHTARKNNGVIRTGLMIAEKGVNISPAIYLEEYYEQFREGDTVEEIASDILRIYAKIRFPQSLKEEQFLKYTQVEDKLVFRLVGREANEELLQELPHVPYLDMAMVFYVLLEVDPHGTASMQVTEEHMRLWGITLSELKEKAVYNTPRLLRYEFQTIQTVIEELSESYHLESETYKPKRDERMYVLSNELRSFGAAAILYKNQLHNIGMLLRQNYYVLPSSVHEVIIIPESEAPSRQFLDDMVAEINEAHVEPEEVLTDHAYYYDRKFDRLEV